MSRAPHSYSERTEPGRRFEGYDVGTPVAGFYRMKLRSGGVYAAIRIWYGAPRDPLTGEEMDRHWRWQAEVNGEYIEIDRVWPACGREPIAQDEHDRMCRQQDWARGAAPESAYADTNRKIDLLSTSTPLPF